jgi:hypothetical protein
MARNHALATIPGSSKFDWNPKNKARQEKMRYGSKTGMFPFLLGWRPRLLKNVVSEVDKPELSSVFPFGCLTDGSRHPLGNPALILDNTSIANRRSIRKFLRAITRLVFCHS